MEYCSEISRSELLSQEWWHTPVILAFGRLRQEDREFEASMDYTERPCQEKELSYQTMGRQEGNANAYC
jgi:hypothetical protein